MRRRWRVDAPGQGSARKMAAAVTFCRLLSRSGGATALSLPQGARRFGVRTSPTGEKVTHTGQVSAAAWRASERRSPVRPRVPMPVAPRTDPGAAVSDALAEPGAGGRGVGRDLEGRCRPRRGGFPLDVGRVFECQCGFR